MDVDRIIGPLLLLLVGVLPSVIKAARKREEAQKRQRKLSAPPSPRPSAPAPAPQVEKPVRKVEKALEELIGEFFSEEEAPPPPPPPEPPLETIPEGPEAVSRELPVEGADALERIPEEREGYRRPFGREGARPLERVPHRPSLYDGPAPSTQVKRRRRHLRGPLSGASLKQAVLLREILGPCRALQDPDAEPGRS